MMIDNSAEYFAKFLFDGRLGIMLGSLFAGVLGYLVLRFELRRPVRKFNKLI